MIVWGVVERFRCVLVMSLVRELWFLGKLCGLMFRIMMVDGRWMFMLMLVCLVVLMIVWELYFLVC